MIPRRRRGVAVAAAVLLLLPAARAGARRATFDNKAYEAAAAAWDKCFAKVEPKRVFFPAKPDPDDYATAFDVKRTERGFRIDHGSYGNGVESTYDELSVDFEPQDCRAFWALTYGYDGALGARVTAGWMNRDAPTDAEIGALIAEPGRPDDVRHAFARAWLGHRCPGGPGSALSWEHAIEGPIAPKQPSYEGPPRRHLGTFWSATTLNAVGAASALRRFDPDDDEDAPKPWPGKDVALAGVLVPSAGKPVPTFAAGRFQLYEAKIPGRNEGRAIAVLDRAAGRHR